MTTKYPDIEVSLSEIDGNAYSIIRAVKKAMRRAGVANEYIEEFSSEATSGDYDNVLQTCMKWVETS